MEVRFAPVIVLASLGLFALLQVYRALPFDLNFDSLGRDSRLAGASKLFGDKESWSSSKNSGYEDSEKSIAQVLKEKVEKGLSTSDESRELAGLDHSTRALLAEVLQTMAKNEAKKEGDKKDWGLFNYNYGVLRVVKRLVVCSAYRTSLREFTLVTLSPDFTVPTSNPDFLGRPPKDPATKRTCTWLADGSAGAPRFRSTLEMQETGRSSVGNGVAEFRWIGENHGASYDVLIIHCTFPQPVGMDLTGGFLYMNFTHGPQNSSPTELAPVFQEEPKTLNASLYESPRKFQYEFAYCSGPVFTALTPAHVKQFLMYHYGLFGGSVHFFIYDSHGLENETMAVLQPLIDAGSLTIVDFTKERDYNTWYHSQDLAINDCLYRARLLAKWALFWDMDEYLHVRSPHTLPALLEQHKDVPWITFGKIEFSLRHCAPGNGSDWAVERMVYREQHPICGESCRGPRGARKWMANPRKVLAGRIHDVVDPVKGGLVLSTRVAIMNHYRGLVAPRGRFNCQDVQDPGDANYTTIIDGRTLFMNDLELASIVNSTFKSSTETLEMFGGPVAA